MQKIYLILVVALCPLVVHAYPNYIGKGYHACLTCHYNPFGNGPLNDYGRGVAATALSGRLFVSDKTTNEHLSERAGFLFNTPKGKFFRPALDYRGMEYQAGLETDDPQGRFIHMQMDASGTFLFGKNQNTIVNITYGTVPSNSLPAGKAEYDVKKGDNLYYSREHYIGQRITPSLGVYLGKMDKVFGVRVVDHTAYSRIMTDNHQHSATHGIMAHYGKEKFDFGAQYFLGDYEKLKEYRSSGIATKFEYSITDNTRLGVSYLNQKSDDKSKKAATALIGKTAIGKGSSILLEYGNIDDTRTTGDIVKSQYLFMQNHIYLTKGLFYMTTFEHYNPNTAETKNIYKISPGIQWMPVQRLELRFDLTNKKTISTTEVSKDSWSYAGQVHLWF